MKALGRHLLIDLYDCDERLLDDREYIETQLHAAAEAAGARILGALFHRFSPHGVTGVLVVQESHLAVHTWLNVATPRLACLPAAATLTHGSPIKASNAPLAQGGIMR